VQPDPNQLTTTQKQAAAAGQSLTDAVSHALAGLNKRLLDRKTSTAKTLSIYNKWSMYIYIVGWSAALAGRVMGVDGLDAD